MRSAKALAVVVMVLIAMFVGRATAKPTVVTETRVDTVAPEDYQDQLRAFYMERDGLRARLEGVEAREPEVIVRTDTVVAIPDTVYRFVNVDSRGSLTVETLVSTVTNMGSITPDSTPIRYAPSLYTGIDISDCDDGFQIRDGVTLCNRARLGHLWVGPELSRSPGFSMWWKPNYRSPWEVSVAWDGAWDFGLRRGVRLW